MKVDHDKIFFWPVTELLCKTWKIPYGNNRDTFAIFPLNHLI